MRSERILIKSLDNHELEKIYIWKNDFELSHLLMAHPLPVNARDVEDWLNRNQSDKQQVLFGIFLLESNECIGIVRLMFIDWISATSDLGIYIGDKRFRCQGIGQEVLILILNYAFTCLNLHKVSLKVLESNINAIKCYERCGFVKEGILREQYWCNGKYEHVVLMGILRGELTKNFEKYQG
jgi:RimJ/RimL family protein N-acetyltransferase